MYKRNLNITNKQLTLGITDYILSLGICLTEGFVVTGMVGQYTWLFGDDTAMTYGDGTEIEYGH